MHEKGLKIALGSDVGGGHFLGIYRQVARAAQISKMKEFYGEEEISERDHRDMTRDVAPLRQADDAVLVDSSDMTINEVTSHILNIIRDRTGSGRRPVPGL